MQHCDSDGQMMLFPLEEADEIYERPPKQKSKTLTLSTLISIPYFHLDLSRGHVDLFGCHYWEFRSPWRENGPPLNTGPAPREPIKCALSDILETSPQRKYYLSRTACLGILRRAEERSKELPPQLKEALMAQAGLGAAPHIKEELKAYHINQRDEGIDLYGVSGALMATSNMQMQTFVTGGPVAFATNQRDEVNCRKAASEAALGREVRALHDIAGAVQAQPGMKQQTIIEENCLNPWDTQQAHGFTPEGKAPTLAGAGGGGRIPGGLLFAAGKVDKGNGKCFLSRGRHTSISGGGGTQNQGYPCVLTAGFCAGAAPTAGGIGYQEEVSPTLKASESGTNMVPSVLCLNDQGGSVMECGKDVSGTLRAQEHGHQPLVLATQQGGAEICPTITAAAGTSGNDQPALFENHGIDARYKGPLPVAPTLPARAGTGGNNLSLIAQAADSAVFSRQRVDIFKDNDVVSTESARQHKDATDLVYQETVGALTSSGRKGPNSQYVGQDKLVVDGPLLIRRLTPLECERLQGFPDGWTDLPGSSDSARYRALGNSVAIPCVEFVMRGVSTAVLYWLSG